MKFDSKIRLYDHLGHKSEDVKWPAGVRLPAVGETMFGGHVTKVSWDRDRNDPELLKVTVEVNETRYIPPSWG